MVKQHQKRLRRTAEQLFIDKLNKLSSDEQPLVQNSHLREALGWDNDKYSRVRLQLKREQLINVGAGQGGKVGLAKSVNTAALKLFVSYSHIDVSYKNELLKHLDPLTRLKLIDTWSDGKINAGKEISAEIDKELTTADIILLLVSIDYINSYYCVEIEMEKAMERHERDEARVVPIILRSCMWKQMPFAKLKALPLDAKAVATWPDRDEALSSVAEDIRVVADELITLR